MCYVIITFRTLLWLLLTALATCVILAAVITPQWLVGPLRRVEGDEEGALAEELAALRRQGAPEVMVPGMEEGRPRSTVRGPRVYAPTLGLYNMCSKIDDFDGLLEMYTDRLSFEVPPTVGPYSPDSPEYSPVQTYQTKCPLFVSGVILDNPDRQMSHFWKVSVLMLALGLLLMAATVLTSLLSFCLRSACNNKSLFTVSGLVQAIAGLLFVIALIIYPAGWSSERVELMCGSQAGPYLIGNCSLGWAFYLAVSGTVLTFLCAVMSIQADISTSSDKVQEEIYRGKVVICLA